MARDAWDVNVARFGGARMWRSGAGFVELSESALVVTGSGRVLEAGATFTAADGSLSVLPHPVTPLSVLHRLQGCAGRADGCASCGNGGSERYEGFTEATARLLAASSVKPDEHALFDVVRVVLPVGTTFDAAEALRLEVEVRFSFVVTIDVQIAEAPPGSLSPEDEAGARLFATQRAERLNPAPSLDDPYPWETPAEGSIVVSLPASPDRVELGPVVPRDNGERS